MALEKKDSNVKNLTMAIRSSSLDASGKENTINNILSPTSNVQTSTTKDVQRTEDDCDGDLTNASIDDGTPRKRLKIDHSSSLTLTPTSNSSRIKLSQGKPLVTLRNSKLAFHVRPGGFAQHTETILKIVSYRKWRESVGNLSMNTEFPKEILELIAMLVQDSSSTLNVLAKQIKETLLYDGDSSKSIFTIGSIEKAISSLATREYYGVSVDVLGTMDENLVTHPPQSLSFYAWQVTNISIFTQDMQDAVMSRKIELQQASQLATELYLNLNPEDRISLLFKTSKQSRKKKETSNSSPKNTEAKEQLQREKQAKAEEKERLQRERQFEKQLKEQEKEQRRLTREHERDEKKRKKEEEKETKASVQLARKLEAEEKKWEEMAAKERSQLKLNSFFKTQVANSIKKKTPERQLELSDWDSMVMPFFVKANVTMSPINRFYRKPEALETFLTSKDPIPSKELLLKLFSETLAKKRVKRGFKVIPVRQLMEKAAESMVLDGGTETEVIEFLKDPNKVKIKVLKFCEDTRPSYIGSWTQTSDNVNGHKPFGKSSQINYDYDSEAEWVDEEDGEDLNDDEDACSEPDTAMSEDEKLDMEEWVAADDEVNGSSSPALPKRKPIGKLVPYVKGPYFEEYFGISPYAPLEQFKFELLLQSNGPIDPFNFVWPENPCSGDLKSKMAQILPKSSQLLPEEEIEFAKFVHGNSKSLVLLVHALKEKFPNQTKRGLEIRLKEMAIRKGKSVNSVWLIKPEHRTQFKISDFL